MRRSYIKWLIGSAWAKTVRVVAGASRNELIFRAGLTVSLAFVTYAYVKWFNANSTALSDLVFTMVLAVAAFAVMSATMFAIHLLLTVPFDLWKEHKSSLDVAEIFKQFARDAPIERSREAEQAAARQAEQIAAQTAAMKFAISIPVRLAQTHSFLMELNTLRRTITEKRTAFSSVQREFEERWSRKMEVPMRLSPPSFSGLFDLPTFRYIPGLGAPTLEKQTPILDRTNGKRTYVPEANPAFLAAHRQNYARIQGWLGNLNDLLRKGEDALRKAEEQLETEIRTIGGAQNDRFDALLKQMVKGQS